MKIKKTLKTDHLAWLALNGLTTVELKRLLRHYQIGIPKTKEQMVYRLEKLHGTGDAFTVQNTATITANRPNR